MSLLRPVYRFNTATSDSDIEMTISGPVLDGPFANDPDPYFRAVGFSRGFPPLPMIVRASELRPVPR